ncbi:MAG: hypothetical protein ABI674_07765 [Spartobacteria bacterium]
MGLDSDGTKFLFAAQAAGVSFRRTAMLGRQNFFPEPAQLQRLLDLRLTGSCASEFLADSKSYAEKFLAFLGAEETVAIDHSAYEGAAIVADMNAPIDPSLKNRFSVVLDGGCLEHIFNFPQAVRNCMEMLEVGGHFLGITPANNFCGHGFYQFSPEIYFRIFTAQNGFALRALLTKEGKSWYRVQDPDQFGGRVELQNNRPTYLFVMAKKTEARELFAAPPQQSDYARTWEADPGQAKQTPATSSAAAKIRTLLPSNVRDTLRPLAAHIPIRHRYACYQPLEEAALLRGDFEFHPSDA